MKSIFFMFKGVLLFFIIQFKFIDEGFYLVEVIVNSGLCNIEVVKCSDVVFEVLLVIRKQFFEFVVGMGILLNCNYVFEVLDVGVQFLIMFMSLEILFDILIVFNVFFLLGVVMFVDIFLVY